MEITTIVWIIAAVVVVLLIGQYFLSSKKRQKKETQPGFKPETFSRPEEPKGDSSAEKKDEEKFSE